MSEYNNFIRKSNSCMPVSKKLPSGQSGWEEILVGSKFLIKNGEILRRDPEFWGKIY